MTSGPVRPVPRGDANSMLAHEQLLTKARIGRIDLYFLGDSITRRWGCSDPQYQHFYAHWRESFFGWNAGNFGWGGDTIENILWRIENGELDGVNPKVISIQAGTNNVGTDPGDAAKVGRIVTAMRALIDAVQRRAPVATIVLTGIFPRNDNIAVMPTINTINARCAQMADGVRIRYLNVNDRMADERGRLFDGITDPDKLHLALGGYEVWADGLRPIFTELLGPRAATDLAPPPTGDPSAMPQK